MRASLRCECKENEMMEQTLTGAADRPPSYSSIAAEHLQPTAPEYRSLAACDQPNSSFVYYDAQSDSTSYNNSRVFKCN